MKTQQPEQIGLADLEGMTLDEIAFADLELVNGGLSWSGVVDAAKGGFGLRTVYREGVKGITAIGGGWKLANEMYGKDQGFREKWSNRFRAMGAFKQYLDDGDSLPHWAPNW